MDTFNDNNISNVCLEVMDKMLIEPFYTEVSPFSVRDFKLTYNPLGVLKIIMKEKYIPSNKKFDREVISIVLLVKKILTESTEYGSEFKILNSVIDFCHKRISSEQLRRLKEIFERRSSIILQLASQEKSQQKSNQSGGQKNSAFKPLSSALIFY